MEFSRYGINGGQNVANIDASMPWSLSKMTVSHIVVLADYDEQRLDARSKGLHMEPIAQYEAKRLHLDYPALFPITTQHTYKIRHHHTNRLYSRRHAAKLGVATKDSRP